MYIVGTILTTILISGLVDFMTAVSPEYMATIVMGSFILYAILHKKGGN